MRPDPFKIERYFAPREFKAPYMLSGSDCESMSVAELLELVPGSTEQLHDQWLGYTEIEGSPSLRRRIAALYDTIEPEDILVHTGAGEVIFTFMNAALSPGDHIIVHYPCYQSLFQLAETIGSEVTRWVTRPESGWSLDLDFLDDHIRPDTRAVVINTPHNPTGYLMTRDDLAGIVEIASRHSTLLFSDEVYRGLEHDPADRLPAACDLYENAVSVGVLSKTYGLPGLRIGWLATRNAELRAGAVAIKDYTSLCNSAPSEILAEIALQALDRIVARNLAIVRANLPLLDEFFVRRSDLFTWVPPRAGAIGFPRLSAGNVDVFCDEVLEGCGVLLLPGTVYDRDSDHFRVGFGRRNMPEALSQLELYLER
jgi:aspartate/methionine/tyrosine aminotransferase